MNLPPLHPKHHLVLDVMLVACSVTAEPENENRSALPSETSQVIIGLLQNGVNCIVYVEWILYNGFDGFQIPVVSD